MKAITILQPWASLIANGQKRIETRSWYTPHRGEIAIHAGKKLEPDSVGWFQEEHDWFAELGIEDIDALPRGCVIATARLTHCVKFEHGATHRINQTGQYPPYETWLGDFSPGRFGWVLSDVKPINPPIPARGYQGLWDWEGVQS